MPQQLTILSGKGGTGKTTVAASFFALADGALAADCDVDAPNLHLLLDAVRENGEPFEGSLMAEIDPDLCTGCGECEAACPFGAITDATVNELFCEGCGVCELVCPVGAVRIEPEVTGHTYVSETRYGTLVHALLNPGAEATGRLVTETKRKATEIAEAEGIDLVIVDGSPGIGCPVIASVAGSSLVLAVTEPTRPGLWGLERIAGVASHFEVPFACCINKADVNPEIAGRIRELADRDGFEIVGEIPFDAEVNLATVNCEVLVESYRGDAASAVRNVWERTLEEMRAHSGT